MWDKLDEVLIALIGTGALGIICYKAISLGYNGGVATACIVGISAIITGALGMKASGRGGNNGTVSA